MADEQPRYVASDDEVEAMVYHSLIADGKSPREAVAELMRRPGRDEL